MMRSGSWLLSCLSLYHIQVAIDIVATLVTSKFSSTVKPALIDVVATLVTSKFSNTVNSGLKRPLKNRQKEGLKNKW